LSVAAHLIHGSSDGRFSICYCTKEIGEEEVRGVNFDWRPYDEEIKKFDPTVLTDGYNYSEDGEEFYYISNPALGLWDVDPDMEKLIDLHTHSTRSDGSMTPTELVRHAKKCGLAAIALSDHDSVEGVAEAMAEGERIGVEVVPALEFSVKSATETHILGYFVDIENAELKDALVRANEVRRLRNNRTCDELRKLGFDVTVEEALAIAPGGMIGRAHYARLLVEKGYTKSVREGFDKYMSVGKPAYCEQQALTAKEAIEVTHAAGGLAFCAHLHLIKLPDDELERFLTELKGYGLDGIEGYYTDYDDEMGERYRAMAERLGLAVSGGTDFHAKMKPHISIGKGLGNMAIPYSVLENIKKLLKTEDK
ncbi:MAG: PHP domain-containing protein, partial [Oscillospiraceae bacterium]|nr:PHP domain-containing protein [Oscillospiraceae bacterium]